MTDGFGFVMEDRDYAYCFVSELDIEAQLMAMRALISRNNTARVEAEKNIRELEGWARKTTGAVNQRAVDEWVDELHYGVYADAAASMSAIGMFAPLLETIFVKTFRSLGRMYEGSGTPPPSDKRWTRPNPDNQDRWNCKIYFGAKDRRIDVYAGAAQLVEATGLDAYITEEDLLLFEALISYRNCMFHMGFEWPVESRAAFQAQIDSRKWDRYFRASTTNDQPWIFYLADETIQSLPGYVEGLIIKLGRFAKSLPHQMRAAIVE